MTLASHTDTKNKTKSDYAWIEWLSWLIFSYIRFQTGAIFMMMMIWFICNICVATYIAAYDELTKRVRNTFEWCIKTIIVITINKIKRRRRSNRESESELEWVQKRKSKKTKMEFHFDHLVALMTHNRYYDLHPKWKCMKTFSMHLFERHLRGLFERESERESEKEKKNVIRNMFDRFARQ